MVSSSWKMSGLIVMKELFKYRAIEAEVIDVTIDCTNLERFGTLIYYDAVERGHEIQEWLDRNDVESYVIIDDQSDMLKSQSSNFVKIDPQKGLTKEDAYLCIKILNNEQ